MNRLGRPLLAFVSLIVLAACGTQAAAPVPTPTRLIAFTLPPSWTPEATLTRAPTLQVTKARPTATSTITPTIRPLAPLATPVPPTDEPTVTMVDPTKSTISGLVLDPLGKPMPKIEVDLATQAKPTQVLQKTVSGSDGRYVLTLVPPGNYRVQTALVAFTTTKCVATANVNIPSSGFRATANLRFAPTCK